ncbi:Retrotransposable element Tf2 155 kDa protein type 3 [Rhizoctonia solani AG-1 IB]|uniref:Retrotransposable element Tf2 155 kDa protein type 3 n=1 Tax=Thanatephorus cucumeris (strain AG1-IB / isolate 7/3/14) TaxID=1108050 RepID=M5C1U7_THACB|nr:Retrotransposable element Tf2 155 kDa protein type 3 [Rhizoctonia solani AG-1 IB]
MSRTKGHVQHFAFKLLSVPTGPWEDVSYDFIVKLPKCRGNNSILTVVDCFSKMVHFNSCKETATAEDIAQLFLEHVWKLHGTSKQTVSDRGPTFNSKFLRALYKALHIAPSYSTAYHPQSDGQTEIKNQQLESYLHPFINHRQSDWVDWLPLAEFTHNNTKSDATGKSPVEIVYGRSPVISAALEPTGLPTADDRTKQLADTIQEVQASIKWAQACYKQADKGKPPPEFAPGDKVWLLASNITSQQPNKKLDHKQYGPCPVRERIGSHAYCLALPETMKIHDVFHVSLLTAYKSDPEFKCHFTLLPPVITAEGKEEYQVVKFVDWAAEDGIWKYTGSDGRDMCPMRTHGNLPRIYNSVKINYASSWPTTPLRPRLLIPFQQTHPRLKRGGCKSVQTSPKPPVLPPCALLLPFYTPNHLVCYATTCNMPVYQSKAKLSFNHCMDVDFYTQYGPEAMKDNLSSADNIIHVLLNASNRRNIRQGGAQSLYNVHGYHWWHFLGLLTPPPIVSALLSAAELHAAVLNFVLLYPADSLTVPVSSPIRRCKATWRKA